MDNVQPTTGCQNFGYIIKAYLAIQELYSMINKATVADCVTRNLNAYTNAKKLMTKMITVIEPYAPQSCSFITGIFKLLFSHRHAKAGSGRKKSLHSIHKQECTINT